MTDSGVGKNGRVTAGRMFIDGKGMGDVEDMVLRDRRRLAHDGIVIVLVTIEKADRAKYSPALTSSPADFVFEDASPEVINDVRGACSKDLRRS